MARSLIASDDFNRANGNIGANWDYLRNTTWQANKPRINSNVALAANATSVNYQVCRWAGTGTFTDDQYAKIKIGGLVFQSGQYRVGVVVRASADLNTNADYYGFNVWSDNIGNYTTQLIKMVNGTETVLNTASRAWANGDTLELEVVTNGSQVDLYCYKNGVAISGLNPLSDTASDRLLTGKPGILLGGDGSSSFATGDDWEGGNIGSGTPSTSTTPNNATMAVAVEAPVVSFAAAGSSVTPVDVSIGLKVESPASSGSTPVAPSNTGMGLAVEAPVVTYKARNLGQASLSGGVNLTVAGSRRVSGSATFSVGSSLSATGGRRVPGSATFSAGSSLGATGRAVRKAGVALSCNADATAAGRAVRKASSILTGDLSLSAAGNKLSQNIGADFTDDLVLTVVAGVKRRSSASLSGEITLQVAGRAVRRAQSTVTGESSMTATPIQIGVKKGQASLSSNVTLMAAAMATFKGSASLSADGIMNAVGRVRRRSDIPTPPERTVKIAAESRIVRIPKEG